MLLFTKLNVLFDGYLDPEKIFQRMKINKFRGDITDISAGKEPPVVLCTTTVYARLLSDQVSHIV